MPRFSEKKEVGGVEHHETTLGLAAMMLLGYPSRHERIGLAMQDQEGDGKIPQSELEFPLVTVHEVPHHHATEGALAQDPEMRNQLGKDDRQACRCGT